MDQSEPLLKFHLEFDESVVYFLFFTCIMINISLIFFILKSMFSIGQKYRLNVNYNPNLAPPTYTPVEIIENN